MSIVSRATDFLNAIDHGDLPQFGKHYRLSAAAASFLDGILGRDAIGARHDCDDATYHIPIDQLKALAHEARSQCLPALRRQEFRIL